MRKKKTCPDYDQNKILITSFVNPKLRNYRQSIALLYARNKKKLLDREKKSICMRQ